MLADDHAFVDLPARLDHHRAAVFQIPQRVGDGFAQLVRDQDAVAAALDRTLVCLVGVEDPVHDRGATRVGEQFALVADQPSGRRVEHHAHASAARRLQLDHLAFAFGHLLHDDAGVDLVDVDRDFFDRLFHLARFVGAEQDLRP